MNYIGNIIRPPSEADSIILQVTVGCSYNKCTFCAAYKKVPFQMKSPETVEADLHFARTCCRRQKRLFLTDGDVLILPQQKLLTLFMKIRQTLPWIKRISLYGNARAVRSKSMDQL
ncbi:MAG: radical SAM protein, partial [Desulforhopalus sp.]